jgi:DNA-binding IclR family transcriptional regulator
MLCGQMTDWVLLSNHGLALLCIARDPDVRLRELAERVGVTERAAHRIVCDLCEGGCISRSRAGRRNRYAVRAAAELRHPALHGRTVGDLLAGLREP